MKEQCKYIEEPCHINKCDNCKIYKYMFPQKESEDEFEKSISKR